MTPAMQDSVRHLAQELGLCEPDAPILPMPEPAVVVSGGRIQADLYTLPAPGDDGEPEPTEERLVVERTHTVTQERVEVSRRPVDPYDAKNHKRDLSWNEFMREAEPSPTPAGFDSKGRALDERGFSSPAQARAYARARGLPEPRG